MLFSAPEEEPLKYTKEDYAAWKKEVLLDAKAVKGAERVIMKLVELTLAASVRPGVEKSYVVFNGLIQAIERVKNEFQMEKHIDAELRDRQATEAGHWAYDARHEHTWVVYKNSEEIALKSSQVVLVCKRTGRVLYEGPASDEG